jgi:hypothetical protein
MKFGGAAEKLFEQLCGVEKRIAEMGAARIDKRVLSLTYPEELKASRRRTGRCGVSKNYPVHQRSESFGRPLFRNIARELGMPATLAPGHFLD